MDRPVIAPAATLCEPPAPAGRPRGRWAAHVVEAGCAFLCGFLLMSFFYSGDAEVRGAPGNDSFYHTRMAALIPEHGLVHRFPWLRYAWFTDSGDAFVSHHYGFHVLLLPFVTAAERLGADPLAGGRWGICVFFGLMVVLLNQILRVGGVPHRWVWLLLFLLLPHQFFERHAYIRAIAPALMFMLLVVWLMFERRLVLFALAVAGFTHLYLGAVMYAPVIVGAYAVASLLGPGGERRFPWGVVLAGVVGWAAAVIFHPYHEGMVEFLRLQVFGTGLTPDIEVGREWRSYDGVWWFAGQMSGVLLAVWAAALVLRMRRGPHLDVRETTLLLLNFGFLLLTLKARRFIEYWPAFGLLSAAYLSAPLVRAAGAWLVADGAGRGRAWLARGVAAAAVLASCGVVVQAFRGQMFAGLGGWYPALIGVCVLGLALAPLWVRRGDREWAAARALLTGVLVCGGLGATVALGADRWLGVRNATRCRYDLPAIAELMAFLKERSDPGELVFTDDWDVFPVYFYHNTHNHFIVGLDPKFTHARRPDLWERFVRITRARVPADVAVELPGERGELEERRIHIELSDIRDAFGARWIIVDRDHQALAGLLNRERELAELVYPSRSYAEARSAPYMLFRVRAPGEPVTPFDPEDYSDGGILYLSYLDPETVEQGWGDFSIDRSVGGGPLQVGGKTHLRGLGTHAVSRLVYEIPPRYDLFEATVGVSDSQAPRGSVVVRVLLDEEEVFASDVLVGGGEAARVSVALGGAGRLTLIAETTADGPQFDHVDWGSARLVRFAE